MGETLGNMRNASNYYELRERRDAESITPEAYPSSQKNVENNDSIDPILEIKKSQNPLDTTLKMIDEGKNLSYIIKSLSKIDFSGGNDIEKNSDAKKQIALKVFSKDGGWKHVLDNWKNLIDLTSEDKKVVINNFKLLVDSAYRKPDELKANESGMNVNTSHLDKNLLEQKVWKDDYYDYLKNNSSFNSVLQMDGEASILFRNILTEIKKSEDDKFEEQLLRVYGDNGNVELGQNNGGSKGGKDGHEGDGDELEGDGDLGGDDDELHGYDPNLNIAGNVDPNHFIDEDQIPKSLHKYIDN